MKRLKVNKNVVRAGIVAALLLVLVRAFAETNTLEGTAPTENVDDTPITDLAAIRVYRSLDESPFERVADVAFTEPGGAFTWSEEVIDGEHCYYATAVRANGLESENSNIVCKTVDTILPKAISDLTIR